MQRVDPREDPKKRRARLHFPFESDTNENHDINAPVSPQLKLEKCQDPEYDLHSTSPRAQRSSLLCRKDSPTPRAEGTPSSNSFLNYKGVNTLDSRYLYRLKPKGSPLKKTATVAEEPSIPPSHPSTSSMSSIASSSTFSSSSCIPIHLASSSETPSASPSSSPLKRPVDPAAESDYSTPPSTPRTASTTTTDQRTRRHMNSPPKRNSPEKPRTLYREASPVKQVYSDRYIPSRSGSNLDGTLALGTFQTDKPPETKDDSYHVYSLLLRNELLKDGSLPPICPTSGCKPPISAPSPARTLRFKSPTKEVAESPYAVSPVGVDSQHLLVSPKKTQRKILKSPSKVLDAPALLDDFYLNLVDWSAQNLLAVGLSNCVYTWSACTSKVQKLCDLDDDSVTSVGYSQRGKHLAVGTRQGFVQLWDVSVGKIVRTFEGHSARVGSLSWSGNTLASGSRDRSILLHDVRVPLREHALSKLVGHKQEVCGLKYSPEDDQLASGGNDNKLLIWDPRTGNNVVKFAQHTAAVKAIAWSPHQHGLLASGGGTADRHIRFWNTLTCTPIDARDTGSQVCNLMWSKTVNEIVSTHGFSLNQIIVWKYPSMTQVATLTGHTFRVLYLAMSPDGQTVVTGAGDETLRFWNLFPGSKSKGVGASQPFFPNSSEIR